MKALHHSSLAALAVAMLLLPVGTGIASAQVSPDSPAPGSLFPPAPQASFPAPAVPEPSVQPITNPTPLVTLAPTAVPTAMVNPPANTTPLTVPPSVSSQTTVNVAPPPSVAPPQTQVEITNQLPTTNPPAPAPNVNIQMPAVNVTAPQASPSVIVQERVTQTDHYIYDNQDATDPNDQERRNDAVRNITLFSVLMLCAAVALGYWIYRRRTIIVDDEM